jgi:hypothetical protein
LKIIEEKVSYEREKLKEKPKAHTFKENLKLKLLPEGLSSRSLFRA